LTSIVSARAVLLRASFADDRDRKAAAADVVAELPPRDDKK